MSMRLFLLPIFLSMALPAVASAESSGGDPEAWQVSDTGVHVVAAGVTVPQEAGGLALVKSGEVAGDTPGLDNYAQFASADGVVQATAFIFMPSYADAAISAYMTDKAVLELFGPTTRRTSYGLVSAGGHKDVALRSTYDGAADGELVTEAAFVHAGKWMVKLRVTGPTDRAQEVHTGMDALLAGLSFDKGATLYDAAARKVDACPAQDGPSAQLIKTAIQGPVVPEGATERAFPRDGQDSLCVRGSVSVGDERYDMLQAAGRGDAAGPIIIPMDDAGKVMRFDPVPGSAAYRLTIHQVGRTDVYNVYDRVPTTQQIAAIIDGSDNKGSTRVLSAAHAPNGSMTVSYDAGRP
jgi:hypothetical protein